ncbi:MAG TPA: hypothetical protein VF753_18490 [Terriglobales bacterium]
MQRLVARFLLTLALSGVLAPVGLAASAPNPHACCKRHPMADAPAGGVEIRAVPGCCNHDGCGSVTTAQWADVGSAQGRLISSTVGIATLFLRASAPAPATDDAHSGRAPPQFFVL